MATSGPSGEKRTLSSTSPCPRASRLWVSPQNGHGRPVASRKGQSVRSSLGRASVTAPSATAPSDPAQTKPTASSDPPTRSMAGPYPYVAEVPAAAMMMMMNST